MERHTFQLQKLGYRFKQRLTDDGSVDYTHVDDNRPYLLNVKEDEFGITHPVNISKPNPFFSNFKTFADWHSKYV